MISQAALKHKQIRRRRPTLKRQVVLLAEQNGCCFYCGIELNCFAEIKGKVMFIKIHWDHVSAYAYSLCNKDSNFVASCAHCNHIKSSKFFSSLAEARGFLRSERKRKGLPIFNLKPIMENVVIVPVPKLRWGCAKDWNWQAAKDAIRHR